MKNTKTKKSESLEYSLAIKILAILALVAILSLFSGYFVFPHDNEPIDIIFAIAPVILFALYVFIPKAAIIIPIIFGIIGLETVYSFLCLIPHNVIQLANISSISNLVVLVCTIPAVISVIKGINKKLFIIIFVVAHTLPNVLYLYENFFFALQKLQQVNGAFLFDYVCVLGTFLFDAAFLLFVLKNKIPPIGSLTFKKELLKTAEMNPEQTLKLLKEKLDLNIITEEEYKKQRADIISKL